MILKGVVVVGATVALLVGTGMRAAPAQNTLRPGDPTQGRVWIQNRGRGEAIPVVAEEDIPNRSIRTDHRFRETAIASSIRALFGDLITRRRFS